MVFTFCLICGKPIDLEDEKEYIECVNAKGFIHKVCPEEVEIKTQDCKDGKCSL
jgi:DNA-directed RNA polymerase subunit RPC12/RpoP